MSLYSNNFTSSNSILYFWFDFLDTTGELSKISVKEIGDRAFEGCSSLISVEGKSLKTIGQYAFAGLSKLKSIYIPEDTKVFLQKAKDAGIPVCTATTNSVFATLIKLSVGGLADINGSPYISGYHPGCEFGDPEGKFSVNYFPDILKKHKYDPETLMMVGDEIEHDFYPALKAGIRYGVVIDRNQKERLIEKDGGIFISDLRVLAELMEI